MDPSFTASTKSLSITSYASIPAGKVRLGAQVETFGYFITAWCSKYTLMEFSNPIAGTWSAPVMKASSCPRFISNSV